MTQITKTKKALYVLCGLCTILIFCYLFYLETERLGPCFAICRIKFVYPEIEEACKRHQLWQRYMICQGSCQYFSQARTDISDEHVLNIFGPSSIC
jgi:hypothetical protein